MRTTTHISATVLGLTAGGAGIEHSIFEVLKPLNPAGSRLSGRFLRFLAVLWPWALALYVTWILGQWVIGHFFNDWLLDNGYLIIVMVLGTLLLTVVATYTYDLEKARQ